MSTSPKNQDALFWDAPRRSVEPPKSKPGEPLFEFQRGAERIVCQLRDHGEHGVEAQFFRDGELLTSRLFSPATYPAPPRQLAVRWAETQRARLDTR